MVAGLISPIISALGNTLEISTLLMRKGLFENILSVGVVDVVEFVYFGVLTAFYFLSFFHPIVHWPTQIVNASRCHR